MGAKGGNRNKPRRTRGRDAREFGATRERRRAGMQRCAKWAVRELSPRQPKKLAGRIEFCWILSATLRQPCTMKRPKERCGSSFVPRSAVTQWCQPERNTLADRKKRCGPASIARQANRRSERVRSKCVVGAHPVVPWSSPPHFAVIAWAVQAVGNTDGSSQSTRLTLSMPCSRVSPSSTRTHEPLHPLA